MLVSVRERLVGVRSQLSNAIRSYAAEFGIIGPAGRQNVPALIKHVLEDDTLPEMARDLFRLQAKEYALVEGAPGGGGGEAHELAPRRRREPTHRHHPGRGADRLDHAQHQGAAGRVLQVGPSLRRVARVSRPRDHSTGGRVRLGAITKAGDPPDPLDAHRRRDPRFCGTSEGGGPSRRRGSRPCSSASRPSSSRWRSPTRSPASLGG